MHLTPKKWKHNIFKEVLPPIFTIYVNINQIVKGKKICNSAHFYKDPAKLRSNSHTKSPEAFIRDNC